MLHHVGLFFHMAAIMLAGGGSIGAILAENQLWKKVRNNSPDARQLIPILKSATGIIQIGLIVFLVSGLIMLYGVNWAFISQPWFIVKLTCFFLLPVRGALVGRPTVGLINGQLQADTYNMPALMKLRVKMIRFHTIQFLLVAVIIFLVIFKV